MKAPQLISALSVACTIAYVTPSAGYVRNSKWGTTYTPTFPVIRTNFCPGSFQSLFAQPSSKIRVQAMAAANEWFVAGGAHVRLRLYADLADTDARCAPGGTPYVGESVIRAEQYFPPATECRVASTSWAPQPPNQEIALAEVAVYAGTMCAGTYIPTAWATNGDYPASGQIDFRSVLLHELGHSLGFDHSALSTAVMWGTMPSGDVQKRFLTKDDQDGLQGSTYPYGVIQTASQHRRSINNGSSWLTEYEPPAAVNSVGAPSVAYRYNPPLYSYFIAQSRADTRKLYTYTTNALNSSAAVTHAERTFLSPAAAASSTQYLVSFVATDSSPNLQWKVSSDAATWSATRSTGYSTGLPPAVAYADWKGWYALAWADTGTGKIRTLISKDGGTTFGTYQEWNAFRAGNRIGLTCQGSGAYCTMAWPDGNFAETKLAIVTLNFDVNGAFTASQVYNMGYDAYGAAIASNTNRFQFVWRDRGYSTVLTSGGWPWPPTLDTVDFTSTTIHSPPSIAWGNEWSEWSAWYSYANTYNQ